MLFLDPYFLYAFLPLTLLTFVLVGDRLPKAKVFILLVASYIFYGSWNYHYLPLLLFSTVVDFFLGKAIHKEESPGRKKIYLSLSILTNLSVLGYFKYFNFFSENLVFFLKDILGLGYSFEAINIILPVGISFYTFQSMSYSIDIYRGVITPTKSFSVFATYISLFPQLVAGPIVRYKEIEKEILNLSKYKILAENLNWGGQLFLIGLAKKVLIADSLSSIINPMISNYATASIAETWAFMLGYTFQIYFDFSGYTDMARGLGRIFGFNFPLNFDSPYKSKNIGEFWRRWHMTLSFWLRDYLYIPLGGNKVGSFRRSLNVVIVFFLGGLWHGANWTFVIWGLFHGLAISFTNIFSSAWEKILPHKLQVLLTFLIVVIGWVFFRSDNLEMSLSILKRLFLMGNLGLDTSFFQQYWNLLLFLSGSFLISWALPNSNSWEVKKERGWAIGFAFLLGACMLSILSGETEFLYYQF